ISPASSRCGTGSFCNVSRSTASAGRVPPARLRICSTIRIISLVTVFLGVFRLGTNSLQLQLPELSCIDDFQTRYALKFLHIQRGHFVPERQAGGGYLHVVRANELSTRSQVGPNLSMDSRLRQIECLDKD